MTTLAFPDTTGQPTDGSFTYEANGVIYSWTGDYWAANNAQGFDHRYVNVDGDQMTGDLTVPSLNGGPLAGMRNQIINGDFRVWQRATSYTPPNNADFFGYQTADRWAINGSNRDTGEMLRLPQSSSTIQGCPKEFPYALAWYEDAATGGFANRGPLIQCVELPERGAGPFQPGTQWTFSCYSNVDITGRSPSLSFSDSYQSTNAVNITTDTPNWEEIEAPTANRWGRYAVTYTIDNVEPTFGTHTCVRANLGPIGTIQTRVAVTGIQLEPSPVATPFEMRPIGTELALCQRYYRTGSVRYWGAVETGQNFLAQDTFAPMRIAPTVAVVSTLGAAQDLSAFNGHTVALVRDTTVNSVGITSNATSTGNPGRYWYGYTADAEL